ncbi:MAG: hypothetical protein ABSC63_04560 [Candidatus Binataceae bacterium]
MDREDISLLFLAGVPVLQRFAKGLLRDIHRFALGFALDISGQVVGTGVDGVSRDAEVFFANCSIR